MEKRNLWLDDIRQPPEGWLWAKDFDQFRTAFELFNGQIHTVSFDNDLGSGQREGWEIANWLLREVMEGRLEAPEVVLVHSMNPVARSRIILTAMDIIGLGK